MADQHRTAQEWAWDYLKNRLKDHLGPLPGLLESSENLPKITTFADLKEGELFIRFPWFRVENEELVFRNTELYRKIRPVRYMDGSGSHYSAIRVTTGSLQEIPDNEPVIVVR